MTQLMIIIMMNKMKMMMKMMMVTTKMMINTQRHHCTLQTLLELEVLRELTFPRRDEVDDDEGVGGGVGEVGGRSRRGTGLGAVLPLYPA